MGQFPEAELTNFVGAVEMLTQQLASVTATPPHLLNLFRGQLTSAESIEAAEAPLVAKASRKTKRFGEAWEEVMRLAYKVRHGAVPETMERLETIWRDVETVTRAQAADAALKLVQGGILPVQQAQEDLGYSPQQIERMRAMTRSATLDRTAIDLERLVP